MKLFDGEKYYHKIPGLLIGRTVTGQEIEEPIDKYIACIPELAMRIQDGFLNVVAVDRMRAFVADMEEAIELLKNVCAKSLESEAARILRCVRDDAMFPYAEKNIRPFITSILSLSIALQRAQTLNNEKREEYLSKIEMFADTAKNITEVSNIIYDGDIAKARTILFNLVERIPNETGFVGLLNHLKIKDWDKAKLTVRLLKDKYEDAVKNLSEADMSKTILAVDDMPEILSFVNAALKNHFKVIAVPSAKDALSVLEFQRPDLFLLDIAMPEMDGFELTRQIRQNPEHEKTPLIFLTGNADHERVKVALALGANDFIVKPSSYDALLTKVSKQFGVE